MNPSLHSTLQPVRDAWRAAVERRERSVVVKLPREDVAPVAERLDREGYVVTANGESVRVEW